MDNSQAANKVWFITGASSGFGRAIAEEVLQRGGRVVALARNSASLAELQSLAPSRVLPLELDVTKPAQIDAVIAQAYAHFGSIDVLVNNAGFSIVGAIEETDEETLRVTMETMFFGPARLTRAVLPRMRAAGSGNIVQITSVGGLTTAPGFGAYCAAKHALEALSESLAAEVAPHGIRTLIVEPGAFRTSLFGAAFRRMPPLPAYAETVGPTRDFASNVEGKQEGDPRKAARVIVDAVLAKEAPLRLPLGADAVEGIRAKLARVAADVDSTEAVAKDTRF
jgi:NAD(P)-dependent dehydrogenase (short-subunit alcohol dehydrogenase family)